jgi:hypothetical protein
MEHLTNAKIYKYNMRHWSQSFIEPKNETTVQSGDTVNDISYYDPETENLNSLFGDGRSGAMPTHNCKPAIGIVSPITGGAMMTAGSFAGLLGKE